MNDDRDGRRGTTMIVGKPLDIIETVDESGEFVSIRQRLAIDIDAADVLGGHDAELMVINGVVEKFVCGNQKEEAHEQ